MRAAEDDAASCIDAVAHTAIVLRSRCRRGAARAERSADSRQYAGHRRGRQPRAAYFCKQVADMDRLLAPSLPLQPSLLGTPLGAICTTAAAYHLLTVAPRAIGPLTWFSDDDD